MLGQRVRRREDPRFLTGNGRYVDDLELEGALHATFVRSDFGHATITSIDTSGVPDTARVFTAADVDLPTASPMHPAIDAAMGRPPLASGTHETGVSPRRASARRRRSKRIVQE